METESSYSVIIVGAGMASLAAAKTLSGAGIHNFLILEAQEKVGGRTISIPIDETGNNFIDLGAQWIHGEDNPVFGLAKQADLLSETTFGEGQGLYMRSNGESIPSTIVQEVAEVVENILEDCCQFVNKLDAPDSVGEFLTTRFNHYLESCNDPSNIRKDKLDLFDWHKRYQIIDNSCNNLDQLSAKSWGLYKGGAEYNSLKRGFSSLVTQLTSNFPLSTIRTLCEVKIIKYSSDKPHVKVICENGTQYSAEHVIVTCSLGYLKENVDHLFRPPLPQAMCQAIHNLGFDTQNKLFLVYDSAWWPNDFKGIQLIWGTGEKINEENQSWLRYVTGFDVMATMYGVLLGWVAGEGAVTMESLSDQEISLQSTSVIRRFMRNQDIPPPDRIFRSKWGCNKFTRGSFSYTSNKCDKGGCGPEMLAQPIYVDIPGVSTTKHPAVLMAGEAANVHYFATAHGAYMSGVSRAQLIIDYVKEKSKEN